MNKSQKRALIFAAICIVLGFAISFVTAAARDFDWRSLGTSSQKLDTVTHTVKESFQDIQVDCSYDDVRLLPSPDGSCKVECLEGKDIVCRVEVTGDTLQVRRTDDRSWNNRFVFLGDDDRRFVITLYLPETRYRALTIHTASGDVSIPAGFRFETAELSSSSGELKFQAQADASLVLSSTSGDLSVSECQSDSISLSSTSGEIQLKDITAVSCRVKSVSGDAELESLQAETLNAEANSGELELKKAEISGEAVLQTVSGDVELDRFGAGTLSITTSSGEVKGTLLHAMDFETHSSSGSIQVPDSDVSAGHCIIRTTSGDIKIKLAS